MTGLQLTSLREGREPVSHRRHITSIGAALVLAVVLSAAAACASARAVDSELAREPVLASWIDSVDRSKLEPTVDDLSGETSPLIGGSPFTILTRSSKSGVSADMVEQYVYEHLLAYGLTSVGYQSFARDGATYRNVVGEIAGTRHPNEIVIVGQHLDSESGAQSATLAPGADDNASSVAAALHMARVFADQKFDRTIRFVFFDGEEVGHYGSLYYANKAKAAGETIVAMFSPDMIAYNAGSGVLGLHTREPGVAGEPADRAMAQLAIDVVSTYSITGVRPTLFADGKTWSDHESFWNVGYPAIMVVQDFDQFDPRSHTPEDTVSHFVWPYYVGAAKTLLGTVACEAGLMAATPTTTAIGAIDNAWYRKAVQVTLAAVGAPGGSAVASITYAVDRASPTTTPGATAKVTVPVSGSVNGPHRLVFHATDASDESEPNQTVTVNLDTVRPKTRALAAATVRRYGTATLKFRVIDALPNGSTARVVIKIKNAAGRVVKTVKVGVKKVNRRQSARIKVVLPKRTYRFFVYARDKAGNRQSAVGHASLLVE